MATNMNAPLYVEGLCKNYPSFRLKEVSFALEKEHLKTQSCVYQRSATRCHSKDGKPRDGRAAGFCSSSVHKRIDCIRQALCELFTIIT